MSRLSIFPEKVSSDGRDPSPEQLVCTDDPEQIGTELFRRGIGFECLPAGTRHWFNNSEGWVAKCTGSDISRSFPGLD